MNGYFAGDNCVHDLAFDYAGNRYAAGEGVVCVSSDSGNHWTQIYNSWSGPPNFSLYNWDIELGNDGIYVTGSNANAPEVPFMWRYPPNTWWDTVSTMPVDTLNPEMRRLSYIPGTWGDDVYIGGHGVYVYHIIIGGIEEHEKNDIAIYPNPFYDAVNIDLKNILQKGKCIISIYDSIGKLILKEICSENFKNFNLNNFLPGMYFIQLIDGNANVIKSTKIIKY